MEELKQEAGAFLKVRALWRFFEAERDGNAVRLFAAGGSDPFTPSTSLGNFAPMAYA